MSLQATQLRAGPIAGGRQAGLQGVPARVAAPVPATSRAPASSGSSSSSSSSKGRRGARSVAMRATGSTKLMNAPETLVSQALDGLLMTNPHMTRLDGYPDLKVILNKEHDKSKHVAVIAGGGAGHEPGHAGYVGPGMLTSAVSGEVFASPGAHAILTAIRQTTGPAGCVLVVMNYTGDRLHFGLAAEQAKSEGFKVEMVAVGDDLAIDEPGLAGRRGIAGTILINKIAGALAAKGAPMEEVVAKCRAAATATGTMGVALRVCTLPGKPPSDRIPDGQMEVGLGIHGEPGTSTVEAQPAKGIVDIMVSKMKSSPHYKLQPGERVVALVNNLGSSTPLEMNCMAREALEQLKANNVKVERCWVGAYMTSVDMSGASLTVMRLPEGAEGDERLALLDAACTAPGWPQQGGKIAEIAAVPLPPGARDQGPTTTRPKELNATGSVLDKAIRSAASSLLEASQGLNELDAKVGDGDCGDTVAYASQAILRDLDATYPLNGPVRDTLASVGRSVRNAVGGSSGALYDIAFAAAAATLGDAEAPGPKEYAPAFRAAVDAIQKYGGAYAGARTMLDGMLPAVEALEAAAAKGTSSSEAADATAAAAEAGAEATKGMKAAAGRSSYVPEEVLKVVPDPGAVAVSVWLRNIAKAIKA